MKIKIVLASFMLLVLTGCGGIFGLSKAELQAKADLAKRQAQELTRLNCTDLQNLKTKKYKDGKTFIAKLKALSNNNGSTDIGYVTKLSYFLNKVKFNKNDFMYIEANKVEVFQNIPNLGVLIRYKIEYGNELVFLIKGYQDVDGATIDKDLILINDGTYSYKAHFGIKTVYSFKLVKDKDNSFIEDLNNLINGNYINEAECSYISNKPVDDNEKVKLLELSTVSQYKRLQYLVKLSSINLEDLEKIMLKLNLYSYELSKKGSSYNFGSNFLIQVWGGDGSKYGGDERISSALEGIRTLKSKNEFTDINNIIEDFIPAKANNKNVRDFLTYKGLENWDKASNATIAEASQ